MGRPQSVNWTIATAHGSRTRQARLPLSLFGSLQREIHGREISIGRFHADLHLVAVHRSLVRDGRSIETGFPIDLVAVHLAVLDVERIALRALHASRKLCSILLEGKCELHAV